MTLKSALANGACGDWYTSKLPVELIKTQHRGLHHQRHGSVDWG